MARWNDDSDVVANDPNYRQILQPFVKKVGNTSLEIYIYRLGMPAASYSWTGATPTYKFTYQRVTKKKVAMGAATTVTDTSHVKVITGLVADAYYLITTQVVGGTAEGNKMSVYFKLSGATYDPTIIKGGTSGVGSTVKGISYLEIKGGRTVDKVYNFAYRSFDAVQVPASIPVALNPSAKEIDYAPSYPGAPYHFAFGTSFKFPPLSVYEPQEGGIGFFISPNKESGYYVTFATSGTAQAKDHTPVRIIKVQGKQIKVLKDSQKEKNTTLDTLFSGETHYVDVKVKVQNQTITIIANVDGQQITATDTNKGTAAPFNEILPITNEVSLLAASGTVLFDYVYATNIKPEQYSSLDSFNIYQGQFSDNYLQIQYGDIKYYSENADEQAQERELKRSYDEFGTVVREIAKREVSFGGGASVPNAWTTGANTKVKILAQDKSSFGSDVFVLNNTSTTVPLSDEEVNSFAIYGSTIGFSGDIEYYTDPVSEYAIVEPITFESTWLQNEKDVESLADFIKDKVVNKAKIIDMTVFGNPLISVGDIINVNYPYHKFFGTEKIIVTHVNHSFSEGLQTTIKGRTI